MSRGRIQNEDVKSVAELQARGGSASQLPNDDKVWVKALSINKTLNQAIEDGDIGSGEVTIMDELMDDYLASSVYLLGESNDFVKDADSKVDPSTTATLSSSAGMYEFDAGGEFVLSDNFLDPVEFLGKGLFANEIVLIALWGKDGDGNDLADPNAIYEATDDGGNHFQSIEMERIGEETGVFVGKLEFDANYDPAVEQEYDTANGDANTELVDTGADLALAQPVTFDDDILLNELSVFMSRIGTPAGNFKIKLVGDDTLGKPSTSPLAVVHESADIAVSSITGATPEKTSTTIDEGLFVRAGDYHLVVETDATYQASFSTGVDAIRVEVDSSSPGVDFLNSFDGSTWSTSGTDAMTYQVQELVESFSVIDEYSVSEADATLVLDDTSTIERAQPITVAEDQILQEIELYITKTGSPVGNLFYKVINDDGGSPSTDDNDTVLVSGAISIEDLAAGNNTVTKRISNLILVPGTYHVAISTDQDYKDNYDAGVDEIAVRVDSSSPTPDDSFAYNGTVWSSVTDNAFVYKLSGRPLSVQVKITSSGSGYFLKGYGVAYYRQSASTVAGATLKHRAVVDGDLNTTSIPLSFTPTDPDLLFVKNATTGDLISNFEVNGDAIEVPDGTFDDPGTIHVLKIVQLPGGQSSTPDAAIKLLRQAFIASLDGSINQGLPGRGIPLMADNGKVIEITVKETSPGTDEYEIVFKERT